MKKFAELYFFKLKTNNTQTQSNTVVFKGIASRNTKVYFLKVSIAPIKMQTFEI